MRCVKRWACMRMQSIFMYRVFATNEGGGVPLTHEEMDGRLFVHVVKAGVEHLLRKVEHVDALNVFPVPDGDTGTNMNLTLSTGVDEMRRSPTAHIGEMAGMLSRG